jgi:peptidoglycan/xylan/chitin deacetylase (PgdA/CDA1 family)
MGSRLAATSIVLVFFLLTASCNLITDPKHPSPIICLTFDDQHANVYSKALPIMQHFGYRGSCFVNSNKLSRLGKLSVAEVASLSNQYHWEIGGHSLNHENLSQLSYTEAELAIGEDFRNLQTMGVYPRTFAIPSGNCPAEYFPIVTQYYSFIRGSSDFAMHQPLDKLSLGYFPFQSGWSASIVKERIRRGIVNRENLIVIGFHRIDADTDAYGDNCPASVFSEIIDYINELQLEVLPLAEAVDKLTR